MMATETTHNSKRERASMQTYLPDGDAGRGTLRLAVRVAHTGL